MESDQGRFPFNVPVIKNLKKLEFSAPVTVFVGENGSGKSTLLEALACAAALPAAGAEDPARDSSLEGARRLSLYIKLAWQKRTHRGFFLRAEDFFGFARRMARLRDEMQREIQTVDEEYKGRSALAVELAKSPYRGELGAIERYYGDGLDSRSHGESFLALFQARFVPGGLYLLDEPEAPLSPLRQLGLVAILKEMVEQDAQFVIATHSPIIMAYPGATLLNFDSGPIHPVGYDELEHVNLVRQFLNDPQSFIQRL